MAGMLLSPIADIILDEVLRYWVVQLIVILDVWGILVCLVANWVGWFGLVVA